MNDVYARYEHTQQVNVAAVRAVMSTTFKVIIKLFWNQSVRLYTLYKDYRVIAICIKDRYGCRGEGGSVFMLVMKRKTVNNIKSTTSSKLLNDRMITGHIR